MACSPTVSQNACSIASTMNTHIAPRDPRPAMMMMSLKVSTILIISHIGLYIYFYLRILKSPEICVRILNVLRRINSPVYMYSTYIRAPHGGRGGVCYACILQLYFVSFCELLAGAKQLTQHSPGSL